MCIDERGKPSSSCAGIILPLPVTFRHEVADAGLRKEAGGIFASSPSLLRSSGWVRVGGADEMAYREVSADHSSKLNAALPSWDPGASCVVAVSG